MNRRYGLIWLLLVAFILVPPALSLRQLASAQRSYSTARSSLELTRTETTQVLELRSRQQRVDHRQRPEAHVLAQVNAVLAEAGIPSQRLQGLRPEADIAVPDSGGLLRRQSVILSFQQLTVPELGQFLSHWRQSQHIWLPGRIELSKSRRQGAGDEAYDATILLSAIYVSDT